jgi:acyl-CoA synthetase (AMP-forming)/AMP-acid ligase II
MIYTGGTTGLPKGVMLTYQAHLDLYSTILPELLIRTLVMEVPRERHQRMLEALPLPKNRFIGPVLRTRLARKLIERPGTAAFLKQRTYKLLSDPDLARSGYRNAKKPRSTCIRPCPSFTTPPTPTS